MDDTRFDAGTMSWARVGRTGKVFNSHGVTSVTRETFGTYIVSFADADQNYTACAVTALTLNDSLGIRGIGAVGQIEFRITRGTFLEDEGFSCIVICPAS